ncbi:protein FAM234A [Colossoma macropomum]|uniref:protein FAM234A n=1 Tax=Colossoma macropomum TaxID=42526 RepID=UPI00186465D7|nr:protein FAM234A [Colossoma macropomum]XP_036437022.1 protein FAM234A [Colossoma macropomum]
MSDSVERPMEAEPLKGDQADGVCKDRAAGCGKLGMNKLTGWRTAAFLLSLFLCLTVVFAFSFILPCPVRPQYLRTWNRTLPNAATYDFLAMGDANKDKVQDVLFIYKSSEGSMNHTCSGEGLPSPCLFLLAVDGTDGRTLWERPLAAELSWVECGVGGINRKTCLVAHADNFTAVDMHTGVVVWQRQRSPVINGNLPVIIMPDLDKDGTEDIAVLSYNRPALPHTPIPTEMVIFSGKSGDMIGSKVDVDSGETRAHLQFTTASGAQYILLHTDTGLYAVGLWRLAEMAGAGLESYLKKEKSWEEKATPTGLIPLHESVSLLKVLLVKGSGGPSPSLLLLTPSTVTLFNTHTRSISWTTNTSTLLSTPSFGRYNEDDVPDVVLEEDQGNTTKSVLILDGKTGRELWKAGLLFWPQSPRSASVLTLNSYSVFMLWGERLTHNNETSSAVEEHSSYLLHPHHPQVLLERRNPTQHIRSFKAVLLERGRHACYLVLSGAEGAQMEEAGLAGAGPVVLTKRKIKDDVEESSVLGVGKAEGEPIPRDKEESVKEAFHRLRFSDEIK